MRRRPDGTEYFEKAAGADRPAQPLPHEYYNYNNPSVSDEVYDRLFDELHKLEQETGIQMSNSPTVTVGYPVVGKLEKTAHKIPLLSLDKVKSSVDLCRFMGEHQGDDDAQVGRPYHQTDL